MVADEDTSSPPAVGTGGRLADRAFGKAADDFGKEIAVLGREAGTVAVRTVRLALRALSDVITGAERVYDWMEAALVERLKDVPEEELAPPSARIALPALQGAVFASEEQETAIREMFANLIAKDMTKEGKLDIHPSFVEIVKQLSTDDAKLLKHFRQHGPQVLGELRVPKKENKGFISAGHYVTASINPTPGRTVRSVYSLARLGLIEISDGKYPLSSKFDDFEKLQLQNPIVQKFANDQHEQPTAWKSGLYLTPIGQAFVRVCLDQTPKGTGRPSAASGGAPARQSERD
jgi:Abortive infection alpha